MNTSHLSDMVIPPGETLLDVLEEHQMGQKELATRMGISEKHLSHIVSGKSPLTLEQAMKLEKVLGGTAQFWVNLESMYQERKARIEAEAKLEQEAEKAKEFTCYSELVSSGFIEATRCWKEKAKHLMKFFRVHSLDVVPNLYPEAHFRNASKDLNEISLSAWLRCGDIKAEECDLVPYNKKRLQKLIPEFKALTHCPERFDQSIQELCASCGVVVVFVPYFKNTKVNGATRWIKNSKHPLIQLNSKGAAGDRFWFTFFHELGHVLLHSKRDRFVETGNAVEGEKEKEADSFATETLIPSNEFEAFVASEDFSASAIKVYAKKWNVHPSIVSGRLAHKKLIDWKIHQKSNISVKL